MPKQPNITLYSCDRPSCVNKEYVLPNATASPNWHEVTRVDRNGNQRKILFLRIRLPAVPTVGRKSGQGL